MLYCHLTIKKNFFFCLREIFPHRAFIPKSLSHNMCVYMLRVCCKAWKKRKEKYIAKISSFKFYIAQNGGQYNFIYKTDTAIAFLSQRALQIVSVSSFVFIIIVNREKRYVGPQCASFLVSPSSFPFYLFLVFFARSLNFAQFSVIRDGQIENIMPVAV